MYRRYPFRSNARMVATNGLELPNDLIVGAQISTVLGKHQLYLYKVYVADDFINLTIKDKLTDKVVGWCSGRVTSNYQTLFIESNYPFIAGKIVIGNFEKLKELAKIYIFAPEDAFFEDSVITCYKQPGVKKLVHNGVEASGLVELNLNNLELSYPSDGIFQLNVINTFELFPNKSNTDNILNCGLPYITRINNVTPDNSGNIDIFGIIPLHIAVGTDIGIDIPTLELSDICPEVDVNYPPENESLEYYTNILETTIP